MGNHTIDCKFCGEDQRVFGDACCAENAATVEAEEAKREARRAKTRADLERLAPEIYIWPSKYADMCRADEVVQALKRLKGEL